MKANMECRKAAMQSASDQPGPALRPGIFTSTQFALYVYYKWAYSP